jgi:short-subunit dehydrogenase
MSEASRPSRPVIAIAGGSSGIGRCTASWFAARGWDVGLVARGEAGLADALKDVQRAGGKGCTAVADVADAAALEKAVSQIEAQLGLIDVWVNGVGVSAYGRFLDLTEADYGRVTQVTYLGTVNGTRAILPRMMSRQRGTIINIGSAVAKRAVPLQSAYSAAKFAVAGFTEAVRAELIHEASPVRLGIVHPPSTNTPFFEHAANRMDDGVPRPPPPIYAPELTAEAIYITATTGRREVKVGGQTAAFGLANTVAPGMLDWALGKLGFVPQASHKPEAIARHHETLFQPSAQPSPVHGPFGDETRQHSLQMAVNRNPGLATMLLGLGVLGAMAWCQGGKVTRRH